MKGRTKLKWIAEYGYLTCSTKVGLMGIYPIGDHYYWQRAIPGTSDVGSLPGDDLTQAECVQQAEEWYYEATHEYPDESVVKLEPGQVVVDEVSIDKALALYDREIEKLGDAIDPADADDYSIEDYMSQLIEERYRLQSTIGREVKP